MRKLGAGRPRLAVLVVAAVAAGALLGPPLTATAAEKIEGVFVTNTESDPVPTKAVGTTAVEGTVSLAGSPVQIHLTLSFSGSSSAVSDAYAVPAGKRFEIRHVSLHDFNRPVGLEQVELSVQQDGQNYGHYLASSGQAGDGDVVSQSLTAYADPETPVRLHVSLDAPLGGGGSFQFMHAFVSGILTDA